MTELKTYKLDGSKATDYIFKRIEGLNALSEAVINFTPFDGGEFLAILREGLSEEKVNEFRNGYVGGGVTEAVAKFLDGEFKVQKGRLCIFDDFEEDYKPSGNWELFQKIGVHYDKEMYYLIENKEADKQLIGEALRASAIIWHSLSVFSSYPYKRNKDKSISIAELENIARSAEYLLYLAYDAEGYIIWKRTK